MRRCCAAVLLLTSLLTACVGPGQRARRETLEGEGSSLVSLALITTEHGELQVILGHLGSLAKSRIGR